MPLSVCPSSCFLNNGFNSFPAEMRNFLVLYNFLRDKDCNLVPVLLCVRNCFLHVNLIAIAADSAPQRRMHVLYCLIISCCHKHKVAWHRLCPYHRACASLALPCNCKLSRSEEH